MQNGVPLIDTFDTPEEALSKLNEYKTALKKAGRTEVIDNVTSTDTDKALSANMGRELQGEINNLKARGRFLSLWDSATGLPETDPQTSPYPYNTGDYFIVGNISVPTEEQPTPVNYRPNGSSYTIGQASTTVETQLVAVNDTYYYDGTNWNLQSNSSVVKFQDLVGEPTDNVKLAEALSKPLTLPAGEYTLSNLQTGTYSIPSGVKLFFDGSSYIRTTYDGILDVITRK